jgi:dipeptidyl-peptidase-4
MRNYYMMITFLCLVAATIEIRASERAKDTPLDTSYLRAHAQTRGFMLGRPVKARPTPDGKAVLFLRAEARVPKLRLYEFDVATAKTRELLTPEQVLKGTAENLSPEEKARRERMRISVGGFTDFQLSRDGRLILVSLSGKLYVVERAGGAVRELHTGPGTILDPKFSPDGTHVAYVRDVDVCVLDLATQKESSVTTDGSDRISHGLAEFVAQEEMGRFSGYWWSPDSGSIAYEEADNNGVETWYVADSARPEQPPHPSFYPRPGKANAKIRLGVAPIGSGKTVWIDWDHERYPYLATVKWEEHSPLTLVVQTRDQKQLVVLTADPATGKTTTLVSDRDSDWLNLDQEVPKWLEDGSGFLWIDEPSTGPQLSLIRPGKSPAMQVAVPPDAGLHHLVDVDIESRQLVYAASTDPTQSQLFRVPLEGGPAVKLTKEAGVYGASFAKNHAIYVQDTSLLTAMPHTTVHRADGSRIGELPSVAEEPPFTPRTELVKVGEGEGFYASLVRPHDFDARKRYPVIVDVYGGPKHQVVTATMRSRLLDQWLADQGFVVVSIDGRGTPGRGRPWERAIKFRFGTVPLDDQVAGLQALGKRFPELDLQRVGIVGWSFGGYMSALAVLKRPDVYKAAVAGAPVTDWLDYDTHYTERYLGFPDTDPAAYKEGSLLTYAADLKRPLLLVHGTADDNVYFRHTLKLADALFRAGKDFELLPLSGLTHMVPEPLVMERLWSRIALHFQKHLGKPAEHAAASSP